MAEPTVPTTAPMGGPDADLQVGTVVGEYRIEGKLGQGGFGAVYKAAHPLIGKLAAIKVLSHQFSVNPEMVSRFVAEARAVNQIRHPNIIDIFSFGQLPDGRQYYVMEFLEGEPLDAYLRKRTRLGLHEAMPILRGVAKALDAAHAKGIAHRDLKAENVLLAQTPEGEVWPKLLDFGIAKLSGEGALEHKTRTGIPMGTPVYMSPEQSRGRDVDYRTDLYALGVLVYVMLTGVFPLDGEDYMTILMRQCNDEPEPPSRHVPGLPEAVDRTVAWLMRKDPAQRPPNGMTALQALDGAVSPPAPPRPATTTSNLVAPRPITVDDAPLAPASRKSLLAIVLAALVLIGGGIAVVAIRAGAKDDAKRATDDARAARDAAAPMTTPPDAAVVGVPAGDAASVDAAMAATVDAAPAMLSIRITGTPPNTVVRQAGDIVGTAPGLVSVHRIDGPIVLVLGADNYKPQSLTVTPDQLEYTVTLVKKSSGTRPKTGSSATGSEPTNDIDTFPAK